jgi:arsenate reductase (thioredoxin)
MENQGGRPGRPDPALTGVEDMKSVLFLCTGNSCRSQIAETVLRTLGAGRFEAFSAGTAPAGVHPLTFEVLAEAGYDVSGLRSKHVDELIKKEFDYIITLCDSARQACPFIPGRAARLHWSLPDPAAATGTPGEMKTAFREVLAEIENRIREFVTRDGANSETGAAALVLTDFGSAGITHGNPASPHDHGVAPDGRGRGVVRPLSPGEAFIEIKERGAVIVDLRPDHETSYRVFDVAGVIYLPWKEFAGGFAGLPHDRPLILADAIGLRSPRAASMLFEAGWSDVASLTGGIIDWERDGLPVRKDVGFELNGQCSCRLRSPKGGNPSSGGAGTPER